jgi:hypothetical protein
MIDDILQNKHAGAFSRRQQLFLRYTFLVLIDLTVLNLFNQYWDLVFIEYFSISLLTALLLQVLLQITIAIEHRVANFFKEKSGIKAKILRGLSTWAIIFGSKLVILEAINISFGSSVLFSGPIHGLVAFILVVIVIIVTEQIFLWIYRSLA